jgi:hypothetical protein
MPILFATADDSLALVLLFVLIALGKVAPAMIPLEARCEPHRRRGPRCRTRVELYAARRRAVQPLRDPDPGVLERMAAAASAAYVALTARHEQALVARRAERRAAAESRKAQRDAFYRTKGVEPGPWAWFKVLPDLAHAILLELAFWVPAVAITLGLLQTVLPLAGNRLSSRVHEWTRQLFTTNGAGSLAESTAQTPTQDNGESSS